MTKPTIFTPVASIAVLLAACGLGVPARAGDEPVLRLRFDETSGTAASDSSGCGNDAVFTVAPEWGAGVVDHALTVDGCRTTATIPNSPSLDIAGRALSIAGWFRVPELRSAPQVILCKPFFARDVTEQTWTFPFYAYGLAMDRNHLTLFVGREGDRTLGMDSAHFIAPGTWYHFAVTYDGSAACWYVNGRFTNAVPTTGTIQATGTPLQLFNDTTKEGARPWQGSLDDLRVYDRVLGATEVAALAMPVLHMAPVERADKPPVYPVRPSDDRRYLVEQTGAPYLIAGDSPHWLFVNLSAEEADHFLRNREAKGINTLWVELLIDDTLGGRTDLSTYDGLLPFTTVDDVATPNHSYFNRMDEMIRLAARHHIQLLLGPGHYSVLWLRTLKKNGLEKARQFGRFLGKRYKNFDNIVWMSGDDFQSWADPEDDAFMLAVAQGIRDEDPRHIQTVELEWHTSGSMDDPNWIPLLGLNAAYTYFPTYAQVYEEYNRPDHRPVFMVEANYELDHFTERTASPELIRRQAWWPMLAGSNAGVVYGHRDVSWHAMTPDWKAALDSPGARQFAACVAFFRRLPWYQLVPDQDHTVLTTGYGHFTPASRDRKHEGWKKILDDDYATTARTADGKLIVSYIPTQRTVTLDMSKLAAPATGRWFDPADGSFRKIAETPLMNQGLREFIPPGANADGDQDWVLLLEAGTP